MGVAMLNFWLATASRAGDQSGVAQPDGSPPREAMTLRGVSMSSQEVI